MGEKEEGILKGNYKEKGSTFPKQSREQTFFPCPEGIFTSLLLMIMMGGGEKVDVS